MKKVIYIFALCFLCINFVGCSETTNIESKDSSVINEEMQMSQESQVRKIDEFDVQIKLDVYRDKEKHYEYDYIINDFETNVTKEYENLKGYQELKDIYDHVKQPNQRSKDIEESRQLYEASFEEELRLREESRRALYDEMERSALAELEESLQNERYYAQNSIKITKVAVSEPNSAGGVDAYINFYNNSNKTIKYVNFSVKAYNAVDDVVTCTIRDKYISNLKYTGPVNPYSYSNDNSYWDCVWYNYQIKYCKIVGVKIDYMDGTNVEISEENMSYLY